MANKLAGQRAKFTKALASYHTSGDESQQARAVQLMAQVLHDAPTNGFSESDVTQGADIPAEVYAMLRAIRDGQTGPYAKDEGGSAIPGIPSYVTTIDRTTVGQGFEWVYAYGYPCCPDRLKIGSTSDDPIQRVATQITTSTPDKPNLVLTIATHDCRALERALHNVLRLWRRNIDGAGAEWFRVTREELLYLWEGVISDGPSPSKTEATGPAGATEHY
jgi:hypothetical protein